MQDVQQDIALDKLYPKLGQYCKRDIVFIVSPC